MKQLSLLIFCSVIIYTGALQAQGKWTALRDTAPDFNNGVMLLLTDGTVITSIIDDTNAVIDDTSSRYWNKLIPDSTGSYINGTWVHMAPMANSRTYFSTQVLQNGKVYVAGGEYGTGGAQAELYDPETDTWSSIPGLQGINSLADANSAMLPDGSILQNCVVDEFFASEKNFFYNPFSDSFMVAPTCPHDDDESTWLKLPDNSILYETIDDVTSQRYIPSLNSWKHDAPLPVSLYDIFGSETGPAVMLPDGRAFFLGSNGNTAYYTPSGDNTNGHWDIGPVIPDGNGTPDAPAAMLPDGRVLCAVAQAPNAPDLDSIFHSTMYFYLFDYTTDSFTQIPAPNGQWSVNLPSYTGIMLNLPDGTVLFGFMGSKQYYIYTPEYPPLPSGKPSIDTVTETGCAYMITGTLFNGISQGSSYGDDWQMATNYPIIRLIANDGVYFARTTNWNSTGLQTGALPDTAFFTVPVNVPDGNYALLLSANGISSDTFRFQYAQCITGVKQLTGNSRLQISPNPSTGVFNIQLPRIESNYSTQVYNTLGQKVEQPTLSATQNILNLSNQPAGMYFVYLQTPEGAFTGKVIVAK